jgi:hypothetical protein
MEVLMSPLYLFSLIFKQFMAQGVNSEYTRKASESAKEAFILKNTKEAARQVAKLLADFHNDKVTEQPY